jgi:hypothetical protein
MVLNAAVGTGEHILNELPGHMSRENIIVASGEVLTSGTVIGKTTALPAAIPGASNVGNGAVTVSAAAQGWQGGSYGLVCTAAAANAGTFAVTAPDGTSLGNLTVAVAFSNGGLACTVADGATDFAVGDSFSIPVALGSCKAWDPGNGDGTQTVYGVLYRAVDATAGAVRAVAHIRSCELNGRMLAFKTGLTAANKETAKAALRALGMLIA